MSVKHCEEFGPILQAIAKTLAQNETLCKLLKNTSMTPLEEEVPQDIFGKNIRVVPLMNETNEESTVLLVLKRGTLNNKNDEFTDLQLLVYVYTPLSQWNILVDEKPNLRPFKIIGEIQKSLYKKAINGIGVITGGDFDLDLLTSESSSYLVEFSLNVFT